MDFMSRSSGTQSSAPQQAPQTTKSKKKPFYWNGKVIRLEWFIFTSLIAVVLLITIGWLMYLNSNTTSEADRVDAGKYQAVFLNGGSTSGSVDYTTYFGHISKVTDKYFVLKDIYYLTTSTSTDNKTVTPQLTKLGCQQLHSPYDQMVINRSQVAFWENLQDSGKVATAISDYIKANPKGPDCTTTTSSTSQSTTTSQSSSSTKP